MKQLEIALELSQRYHLRMLANTCIIMISTVASFSEIAVENPLPEDTSLFDIFTEVCHQADPSLANNLINMKMWLSFLAGYPNGRFFMLSAELCSVISMLVGLIVGPFLIDCILELFRVF